MVGKMANETCIFVPHPPGVSLVKSKLVPGLKFNPDGTIRERTTRWVGCGDERYAATSKATSVRVFLCMTLNLGLIETEKDGCTEGIYEGQVRRHNVRRPEAARLPGCCAQR